jgi:hypothetical protein
MLLCRLYTTKTLIR